MPMPVMAMAKNRWLPMLTAPIASAPTRPTSIGPPAPSPSTELRRRHRQASATWGGSRRGASARGRRPRHAEGRRRRCDPWPREQSQRGRVPRAVVRGPADRQRRGPAGAGEGVPLVGEEAGRGAVAVGDLGRVDPVAAEEAVRERTRRCSRCARPRSTPAISSWLRFSSWRPDVQPRPSRGRTRGCRPPGRRPPARAAKSSTKLAGSELRSPRRHRRSAARRLDVLPIWTPWQSRRAAPRHRCNRRTGDGPVHGTVAPSLPDARCVV